MVNYHPEERTAKPVGIQIAAILMGLVFFVTTAVAYSFYKDAQEATVKLRQTEAKLKSAVKRIEQLENN